MTVTRILRLLALPAVFLIAMAPGHAADGAAVSNIRQYRIADDTIAVYYDLAADGPVDIGVAASFDEGASFTFSPKAVSGDVGRAVVPGSSKRILWDLSKEDRPVPDDVVIRVFAGGQTTVTVPVAVYDTGSRRSVTALRIDRPVRMDGLLSEPFWDDAAPATGFTQRELIEGAPPTERTEVRIVYDEDNLYIGVSCLDSNPRGIIHNELQRDVKLESDDSFTFVLDPSDSKRNGYFFAINPNGARHDGFFYGSELINSDWDGVWDASAEITSEGWSAEIVIPFKTLRFPNRDVQAWGINFRRVIRRKSEEVLWDSWRRDDGLYQLSRAGVLVGMENVKKGRHLEFIPYILTGAEEARGERDTDFRYGLDVRYPLTTDLSLDITTHTDFAQVETDRERINLTRFSLFYPEKRDFFLEGSEIFDYDTGYFEKVYHSRRIGLDEDREQVPILGGVSLAGRAGKYSIGLLNIQTDEKGATPAANHSVVRIKRDILNRTEDWVSPYKGVGWDNTLITRCSQTKLEGRSVAEIADKEGKDEFDAAFDILLEAEGRVGVVYFTIGDEDLERIMRHPAVMIGSDSGAIATEGPLARGKPHPRSFGTFVRVLGHYVREKSVITLEEAVRKMTSLPAQKLQLFDRGLLRPGMKADVAIFNPGTVAGRATYTNPFQYPVGVEYVLVNGQLTVRGDEHLGVKAGAVLRRGS